MELSLSEESVALWALVGPEGSGGTWGLALHRLCFYDSFLGSLRTF